MNGKLIFGLLAAGSVIYLISRRGTNALKVSRFSLKNIDFNIKQKRIIAVIGIMNPTSIPLKVNSIVGDLKVNNKIVGTVNSFIQTTIAANQETDVKVFITPSIINIFDQIKNFLKKGKGKNKITGYFSGSANIEGANIPIEAGLN